MGEVSLGDCVRRQALRALLEQRGISVDDVDVFLESSYTPLPLNSDCFPLASSLLHIHCKTYIQLESKKQFPVYFSVVSTHVDRFLNNIWHRVY